MVFAQRCRMIDPTHDLESLDDVLAADQALQQQIHEELADYTNSWAASNEEGWFYADEE